MGYNGENNTGAESRLVTIIEDIRQTLGREVELTAIAYTKANVRRYVKDPEVKLVEVGYPRYILTRIPKLILYPFELLILVEGSTFTDHFSPYLLYSFLLASWIHKRKGGQVVAYAIDCLELSPRNQRLVRRVANEMDLIITRNADARERLKELGVTKEIIVTTDTAFQVKPPPRAHTDELLKRLSLDPKKPLVGLAAKEFYWWPVTPKLWGAKEDLYRFYPLYHTWGPGDKESSLVFKGQLSRYADYLVEKFDANILLICMERMDYPPSRDIYLLMQHREKARLIPSNDFDLDDITGLLSRLKFLVSTRYHACVLSMNSAIPMMAVSHDTRIESLYKELGYMNFYLDYQTPNLYDALTEKTDELVKREEEFRKKIAEQYERYLKLCLSNRDIFREWYIKTYGPDAPRAERRVKL